VAGGFVILWARSSLACGWLVGIEVGMAKFRLGWCGPEGMYDVGW